MRSLRERATSRLLPAGLACAGIVFGLTASVARAEFTVGASIPAFSLQTPDGKTVALERASGAIQISRNGQSEKPKVLAIHLLQPDCLQCRAQLKALQTLHERFGPQGLIILGISHRGDKSALADTPKAPGALPRQDSQ